MMHFPNEHSNWHDFDNTYLCYKVPMYLGYIYLYELLSSLVGFSPYIIYIYKHLIQVLVPRPTSSLLSYLFSWRYLIEKRGLFSIKQRQEKRYESTSSHLYYKNIEVGLQQVHFLYTLFLSLNVFLRISQENLISFQIDYIRQFKVF